MLKQVFIYFLLCSIVFSSMNSHAFAKNDSLLKIVKLSDGHEKVYQLIDYLESHFKGLPLKSLDSARQTTDKILSDYGIENRTAFECLIKSVCQGRLSHNKESEIELIKAIGYVEKNEDPFLLYILLNYLAFEQTEEGNATGAISSYRAAKIEAGKLGDDYMQLIVNINISDVYYKNNYYSQALDYLNQAESIISRFRKANERIKKNASRLDIIINYNKSEIFFRTNNPDSLVVYNKKLLQTTFFSYYKLYTYQNRSTYYLYLLNHNYKKAIDLINSMRADALYKFDNRDKISLADAYYKSGQTDSSVFYINQLLEDPAETNHPDVKFHFYDILGQIAEKKGNYINATLNYKLALKKAEEYNARLTLVGNISSLIKIDEIENTYNQKNEVFERERTGLIFMVVVALFTIVIIAVIYRNVKQKRHYENLLFTAKKEELSFINSHEVRKHLTNILGLVDMIRNSRDKESEYLEAEGYLFESAEQLDKAIKNISDKLND